MNLDCRPDAHMLEGACVAYEAAVDSYETIQKQGRLVAKRILDPETNKPVYLKTGRFGPYVQRGNPDDEEEKPQNASLLKGMKSQRVSTRVSRYSSTTTITCDSPRTLS